MIRSHFRSLISLITLTLGFCALTQAQPNSAERTSSAQLSLGDRTACQAAIEEIYFRHRESTSTKPSFSQAVPLEVIQRKAEDVILKSEALEEYWGVTITGTQLQAELDRMAAHTKSPNVLRELQSVLGNDARLMAECLARPLLVDRLIQTYYSRDERFHGELKSRARQEVSVSSRDLKSTSGQYREIEWQRNDGVNPRPEIVPSRVLLDPKDFDSRVRELRKTLASPNGFLPMGKASGLREDNERFFSISVLELNNNRVRIATVEWPKKSFESWWGVTRNQLPMAMLSPAFNYRLPQINGSECRDDSWLPTLQLLDPRYYHTAVWTGSEMIVFGGMNSVGTYYGDGARYNPATDTWIHVSTKNAPAARTHHSAVWTGREMIIWGGVSDASGGRYDPITDTWKTTSTVNAPAIREDASALWNGQEMLIWGGQWGGTLNSGARYNPSTNSWTAIANAPLAPRAYQSAVWTGTEMIVWAGYDGFIGQMYGDGARYNPTTNSWKLIASNNAPTARFYHTAVWTGTEMIVWGGLNYPNYDQSGGRYNPATNTWTATSITNAPSFRWFHSAVWTGREMIIQGGMPGDARGGRYNPTNDSWTSTNPTNAAVNGEGSTTVWTGKEIIIWGGLDPEFIFHNDGARYNPRTNSWLRTTTMNVPAARGLHSAVWTGSEMMIWGGFTGEYPNTGGLYDPATDSWKATSTQGAPAGRENAAAVWTGTEAMFWGGDPDGVGRGTGGRYNPVTDSWKLITQTNAPVQRYGHTGIWTGSELIIFGGVVDDPAGWRYNPSTDTWKKTTTFHTPGNRDHHVAEWTGTEMIIWGGFIWDPPNQPIGARYNPSTDTWSRLSAANTPKTRMFATDVWTGSEMIVWGGEDVHTLEGFNDGGIYNPATDTWKRTTQVGAPSPRVAQGVWTGTELLLWGGSYDSSGGRYDPASDSWKPTTKLNAPDVRGGGRWSTVWTGSQMIIWGGIIETQEGNLYCASGSPNVVPVAVDDNYTASAGKQLVVGISSGILLNDSDGNGDLLSALLVAQPQNGSVKFNSNGSFSYKPNAGFVGTDTFTYQANDGLANSNSASVVITVQ